MDPSSKKGLRDHLYRTSIFILCPLQLKGIVMVNTICPHVCPWASMLGLYNPLYLLTAIFFGWVDHLNFIMCMYVEDFMQSCGNSIADTGFQCFALSHQYIGFIRIGQNIW